MTKIIVDKMAEFCLEEDGLALTEYLILLGLLVGGVIVSVGLFGTALNTAWSGWGTWLGTQGLSAPAA